MSQEQTPEQNTETLTIDENTCGILFSSRGLEVVLPKQESEDERTKFFAALVIAISMKLTDNEWVDNLLQETNKIITETSDEELLQQFTQKKG
jgi:hypothetical protein